MVMSKDNRDYITDKANELLEDLSLEDLVLQFDLTPAEVVTILYEAGHLDPVLFNEMEPL